MKNNSKTLFTFLVFLFALSTAFQSYAQGAGPPIIRPESPGGGNKDLCIPSDGNDHNVEFIVAFNQVDLVPFLAECDLYMGYDLLTSDIYYVDAPEANGFVINPENSEEYIFSFFITLTAGEIYEMCSQGDYSINIDLFCLENGIYNSATLGLGFDFQVNLCCNNDFQGENGSNGMYSNTETQSFSLDHNKELDFNEVITENQMYDYYIFDLDGNQVSILRNQSSSISLQEYISNLSIRSGVYFVRFWNGTRIETTKVFKF